ncbi:MAG: SMC-Scp complex subunit ScpB [Alphaproteobacteria bacterium]|nr:SMC-Scp complex subunit ScpB [Alphaproteobacteria bacterium]
MSDRRGQLKRASLAGDADVVEEVAVDQIEGETRSNVTMHPETNQHLRLLEAVLFAAAEPVSEAVLAERLPQGADVPGLLQQLQAMYERRGVNLVQIAGKWTFRTASDLAFLLRKDAIETKRLSRAAMETLAIIAYHQPVTRAEIEEVRGVSISKGSLDLLLEIGWVKPRGRRKTPGRPLTYGTTEGFLSHFGLAQVTDLPGLDDLKAAGLLDAQLPPDFKVPLPLAGLGADEEPLAPDDPGLSDGEGE